MNAIKMLAEAKERHEELETLIKDISKSFARVKDNLSDAAKKSFIEDYEALVDEQHKMLRVIQILSE